MITLSVRLSSSSIVFFKSVLGNRVDRRTTSHSAWGCGPKLNLLSLSNGMSFHHEFDGLNIFYHWSHPHGQKYIIVMSGVVLKDAVLLYLLWRFINYFWVPRRYYPSRCSWSAWRVDVFSRFAKSGFPERIAALLSTRRQQRSIHAKRCTFGDWTFKYFVILISEIYSTIF